MSHERTSRFDKLLQVARLKFAVAKVLVLTNLFPTTGLAVLSRLAPGIWRIWLSAGHPLSTGGIDAHTPVVRGRFLRRSALKQYAEQRPGAEVPGL